MTAFSPMKDIRNYSLLAHNTFGIDARCNRFIEYGSAEEAQLVATVLRDSPQPYLLLGAGSNLLLTKDFDGIVTHSAIKGIEVLDTPVAGQTAYIRCGSGEVWDDVVAWSVAHQLYGMENLSLIPGEVGASAVQNIGAYGAEAKDVIECVEAVEIATGKRCNLNNDECRYGYRDSRFKHDWKNKYLVTHVVYKLSKMQRLDVQYGNIREELQRRGVAEPSAAQLRDVIIDIRRAKLPDPQVVGNAGSFFMNPVVSRHQYEELAGQYMNMPHYTIDDTHEKIPAGWLIDQCGWRGRSVGRVGVYEKQALVLVNHGGASGAEVVALCRAIQQDVKKKFGIEIIPEVNIV